MHDILDPLMPLRNGDDVLLLLELYLKILYFWSDFCKSQVRLIYLVDVYKGCRKVELISC